MDLGFDYPLGATDLVTGFRRFLRAIDCVTFGNWQSVLSKQLLTLIFVKIHLSYRSV